MPMLEFGDERINYDDFLPNSTTGCVQNCFKSYMAPFVFKYRFWLITVLGIFTCLNLWAAVLIPKNTRQESILKMDNPIQKFATWRTENLFGDTTMSGVRFTWGIKPEIYVKPGSDIWRARRQGMIIRDTSFKPELKES